MCRALPGQKYCSRVGCFDPINVDKLTGVRHPFCSVACAIACGETQLLARYPDAGIPKTQPLKAAPAQLQEATPLPPPPPAYAANAEQPMVKNVTLKKVSLKKVGRKIRFDKEDAARSYVSPPATDESSHGSEEEEEDLPMKAE
ncbi:hypothetical protein EDD11_007298 [Mortierella claussenii]|nr:hypothetical protein EDD11_007298 [Mortierella claussenii]